MQPIFRYGTDDVPPVERNAGTNRKTYWRVYKTPADRAQAIKALTRNGFNYFVPFLDVKGIALHATHCDWVAPGRVYIDP